MAPWLAGGLGSLAGDALDGGDFSLASALPGALGGAMVGDGGLGSLFGGGATGATAAAQGAPLAAPGVAAALGSPAAAGGAAAATGANAAAGGAAAGGGGLMSMLTPTNVALGGMALGALGGPTGPEIKPREKVWRPEAQPPGAPTAGTPPAGYIPGISPEWDYGIQPNVARDNLLRDAAGYAEGGAVESAAVLPDPMTQYLSRPASAPQQIGQASQNARNLQARYMAGEGPRGIRRQGITSIGPSQMPDISPIQNPYSDYMTGGSSDLNAPAPLSGLASLTSQYGDNGRSDGGNWRGSAADRQARREGDRAQSQYESLGAIYAEGGKVATPGMDARTTEVQNAIAAIMGDPNVDPQQAMGALYQKLLQQYGPEQADAMIKELVAQVQGSGQSRAMPEAGGPDGMADDMPAMVDGVEPARINSGEMVISKPDLSAIGSGDADKGMDKVTNLLEQVRQEHYGRKDHPERVNFEGMTAGMM